MLGGVVAWPLTASAQRPQAIPKIGYLSDETEGLHLFNSYGSVLDGLRRLGYEEDRNVTIEYRYAAGKVELLPSLAAELVALPVDVIFSVGTVATKAAVAATKTIPVVFARVGDPVRYGIVASLPHVTLLLALRRSQRDDKGISRGLQSCRSTIGIVSVAFFKATLVGVLQVISTSGLKASSSPISDVVEAKQLQILKDTIPGLARVA